MRTNAILMGVFSEYRFLTAGIAVEKIGASVIIDIKPITKIIDIFSITASSYFLT
jgi:hypothetical protein